MPMIISHPDTSSKIRQVEGAIAEKKQELAKLISEEKGTLIKDYTFLNSKGENVLLSDLFKNKEELIIVFYMGIQCKYCTLWADNYNGIAKPITDRSSFVVISHESPPEQNKIKKSRNWAFEMLSRKENTFAEDLGFTNEKNPLPGVATFIKKDGSIYIHHRSYFGPGDNYCNMWDFTTILPKGINNWEPKINY
jgi:predicted dithiol-disulfide oxidoreductase (DUF899 family)